MTRSTAFILWQCGGTNWYLKYFSVKQFFSAADAPLSSVQVLVLKPRDIMFSKILPNYPNHSGTDFYFIGTGMIYLQS